MHDSASLSLVAADGYAWCYSLPNQSDNDFELPNQHIFFCVCPPPRHFIAVLQMNRDAAKTASSAREEKEQLLDMVTVSVQKEEHWKAVNESRAALEVSPQTAVAPGGQSASSVSLPLEEKAQPAHPSLFKSIQTKGSATSKVLFLNNKMTLMLLFNAAFGFIAAFDNR